MLLGVRWVDVQAVGSCVGYQVVGFNIWFWNQVAWLGKLGSPKGKKKGDEKHNQFESVRPLNSQLDG